MRSLIFLLLFVSSSVYSNVGESLPPEAIITPLELHRIFDEQYIIPTRGLVDMIDREEKVSDCITQYITKQSKSYAKIAQNNLYDLMHNFGKIASKISGKKSAPDDISYKEKIETLARIQCEAYYNMNVLK